MAGSQTLRTNRRSFMKWTGAVAGASALVGTSATMLNNPTVSQAQDGMQDAEKTVWSACTVNCGSRCAFRLQVKDGVVARVLPDNTGSDDLHEPALRGCVRGRSIRRRLYNPDRLKTPLRRKVGTMRGDGQWEEISWDEALDELADQIKRVKSEHGPEAVFLHYGSGVTGSNISKSCWSRLLNLMGGYLGYYGNYSNGQLSFALPYLWGKRYESNSLMDQKHSKLVVMFGNNPVETRMSGGGNMWNAQKARKDYNVRTIIIDPRYSESVMGIADEWIPIRPGTDSALVAALVYEMVRQDLHDQAFLDKYCVGFDEDHMPEGIPAGNSYRSYVMGDGPDGFAKTPEWASKLTGIPAARIQALALEIAHAKPCAILQGWGNQRQASGENSCRAICTLPAVTGNIGINGGGNGSREGTIRFPLKGMSVPNPIKTKISHFSWTDAIDHGPEMTATEDGVQGKDKLDVGIKLMINVAGNAIINQHSDSNRTVELLRDDTKLEYLVVVDNHMTPSAKMADLVLPGTHTAEEWDVIATEYSGDFAALIMVDQAVEPMHEAKSHYDMCVELARRFDLEQDFAEGLDLRARRSALFDLTREGVPAMPDEATMQEQGVFRISNPDDTFVSMKAFRDDPEANPLEGSPSGKIEIFSERLWEMSKTWTFRNARAGDKITALPEYLETWEGPEEARTNEQYPLQCIGHHYKGRTHSSYAQVDWLLEAHPQIVWINPIDAEPRGISNGDTVEVFNDRGRIRVEAFVTQRIMPGVLSVPQGAWYNPDASGVDIGGNVNTLTDWHPSPLAKSNAQHTNLVQIEKA